MVLSRTRTRFIVHLLLSSQGSSWTAVIGYLGKHTVALCTDNPCLEQAYNDAVKRRGRPAAGQVSVPLAELPFPLPLSRFQWPQVRGLTALSDNLNAG